MDVINWKIENGEVILLVLSDDNREIEIKLPSSILKELLVEAPPTEEQRIRELLDKIHEIKKKRILDIARAEKLISENMSKEDDAQNALKTATTKKEILMWSTVLRSLAGERTCIGHLRHLIRLSYQEEGRLKAQLLKLMAGRQ